MKNKKNNDFIAESEKIHGKKYLYNLVEYVNARTKVKIVCKEHGEFEQLPHNHKRGNGCPKCGNKLSNEHVISQFISVHGNNYNYALVNYVSDISPVKIICQKHGTFEQIPSNHKQGQGCPKCAGKKLTLQEVINECKIIHNNKYDYSKTNSVITSKKIILICPMHGEFQQTLNNHKNGQGCKKCYGNEKLTQSRAIENFKSFHGNKYDYSKVEYKNAHSKITIVCPEHGEFKQTPNNHKNGNGCPACCESTGEVQIRTFLENKCVKYMSQHKFLDCKNILSLPFDFYLPEYNLCIEYNGMQHYKPIEYFGGNIGFKKRKINDKIKVKYCKDHNISLLIIKYNENVNKKLASI